MDLVFDSGDRVKLLEYASPLFDEQGAVRGAVGAFIDITDRKRLEQQRERLLEAERTARQEAEQANRVKDEFLAGLSHELRTPLNAILGWAQVLLRQGDVSPGTQRGLEVIARNARLQTSLVDDLLDMSRILSGQVRLDVQPLSLATTVEAALESVRPSAEAKGVHLHAALDAAAGTVSGDAVRLHQVVWNLLSNAVKFTPYEGRIDVTLARADRSLELTVADTGVGIDAEFLPHVFERFRQADGSAAKRYAGLGLGLSIVKHLVELHGGSVQAMSPGHQQGATFVVRLPLTALREGGSGRPSGDVSSDWLDATSVSLGGIRVLVVEDDDDSRELVASVLEESGAEAHAVASAADALAALDAGHYHVIVSDIGLPEQDGYALLRAVRARGGALRVIPALALTAYARSEDRRQALLAGFQLHLAKPVDPAELCAAVASLARRL